MNRRTFIKRGALLVPMIFVPRLIRAAAPASLNPAFFHAPKAAAAGASWTLIDTGAINTALGSVTLNTTGANLIVYANHGAAFSPVTDALNSGYSQGSDLSSNPRMSIFYKISPATSSSHTFTMSGAGTCAVIMAFAKAAGTPAFDTQGAGLSSGSHFWDDGTTVQAGSIPPASSADLMLSAVIFDTASSVTVATVDSSYIIGQDAHSSTPISLRFAYKIKANATAENPAWLNSSGVRLGYMVQHMAFT
jgi:hypothetical protein